MVTRWYLCPKLGAADIIKKTPRFPKPVLFPQLQQTLFDGLLLLVQLLHHNHLWVPVRGRCTYQMVGRQLWLPLHFGQVNTLQV